MRDWRWSVMYSYTAHQAVTILFAFRHLQISYNAPCLPLICISTANIKPLTANSGWPFAVSWPKLDPKVSVEKCWAWFLKQEVFLEGKTGVLLAFLPESLSGLPRPSLSFPPPWTLDRRLEDHCYCRISIWRRATCHIFFRGLGHCILHNEPTLRRVLVPYILLWFLRRVLFVIYWSSTLVMKTLSEMNTFGAGT